VSRFLALEGNIRILAVQSLISQIGIGMMYVIWQPYFLSTGISFTQLGTIQTVLNVSTGLGLLTWGWLSDRYGRKPVILASNICRIIAIVSLIISGDFLTLLAFSFFMGFTAMWMMGNPARSALIAESVEDSQRATALSTLVTISQLTSTLVASAGGYIALQLGYTPIFYVCLVADAVGFIVLASFLSETHHPEPNPDKLEVVEAARNFIVPEGENIYLYIIIVILGFSYAVAYSLFYGALTDRMNFTTLHLGFMTTAFNATWAVTSIPLGKVSDRIGRKKGFFSSFTFSFLTVIGFIFFRSPASFIFFNALSALDIAFWMPNWSSYIAEIVPSDKRSMVMGKLDAYGRIGAIPAPWLAGVLLENYGFNAPLYVQVLGLMICTPLVMKLREPNMNKS
jgi:MFS family permease